MTAQTYEPAADEQRLTTQLTRVQALMSDGEWRTLDDIRRTVQGSEAAISARLRDLRKSRFGGHVIERERVDGGLFKYRMKVDDAASVQN